MLKGNQLKFQRAAAKTESEDRNNGGENRHHAVTVRAGPRKMKCAWLSISPGITVRRLRSTTRVAGPLSFSIFGGTANGDDALAFDRKRLGDSEAIVNGDDPAIEKHDIHSRLRQRGVAPGGHHGGNDKGTYDDPHDCFSSKNVSLVH